MATGAWGPRVARWGEKMRRALDLEHWAAFQEGFAAVLDMVVAGGPRRARASGPARSPSCPATCTTPTSPRSPPTSWGRAAAAILQAVCSPIRNPLPRQVRIAQAFLGKGLARPLEFLVGRTDKVPSAPYRWTVTDGPWFDNNLATLEVRGRGLVMRWEAGEVRGDRFDAPDLRQVARVSCTESDRRLAPTGGVTGH